MRKVVPFDQPNAMLAGDSAFHLHSPLDHAVDDPLGHLLFVFVEENNC